MANTSNQLADAMEFQRLVRETCGVELPLDRAGIKASQLIALYRALMGPIPEDSGVQTSDHLTTDRVESGRC